MPIEKFGDGGFIVTGDEIRSIASIMILRNWNRVARWCTMAKGNRPPAGVNVAGFRRNYGLPDTVKTWAHVLQITEDTIKSLRNEANNG